MYDIYDKLIFNIHIRTILENNLLSGDSFLNKFTCVQNIFIVV